MSETTLTNLRPVWSMIQPAIGEMSSGGNDAIATTIPAKRGESDCSRISQGMAIVTMALPRPEARFDACSKIAGSNRLPELMGGRYWSLCDELKLVFLSRVQSELVAKTPAKICHASADFAMNESVM